MHPALVVGRSGARHRFVLIMSEGGRASSGRGWDTHSTLPSNSSCIVGATRSSYGIFVRQSSLFYAALLGGDSLAPLRVRELRLARVVDVLRQRQSDIFADFSCGNGSLILVCAISHIYGVHCIAIGVHPGFRAGRSACDTLVRPCNLKRDA